MTWFDLLILAVLAISVVSAFIKGFLVELFSLAGLIAGFLIAAADYARLTPWVEHVVKNPDAADLIAFLSIALGVMLLAGLLGRLLRGAMHWIGLGFVDRLLGALFGFIKGCAIVTLVVMAIAAFLPHVDWLKTSTMAPLFLTAAHNGAHMTPFEFEERIRDGIRMLRSATTT